MLFGASFSSLDDPNVHVISSPREEEPEEEPEVEPPVDPVLPGTANVSRELYEFTRAYNSRGTLVQDWWYHVRTLRMLNPSVARFRSFVTAWESIYDARLY